METAIFFNQTNTDSLLVTIQGQEKSISLIMNDNETESEKEIILDQQQVNQLINLLNKNKIQQT